MQIALDQAKEALLHGEFPVGTVFVHRDRVVASGKRAHTRGVQEAVNEIASATERTIEFTPISLSAYSKMLEEFQVPADYIWLINYLFTEVLGKEGNDVITNDVEKVLGRQAKDFTAYVRETAATGVWNQAAEMQV